MRLVTLELNPQEAQELAQILDLATKAGGIQVARATIPLQDKLITAVKAAGYQVQEGPPVPGQAQSNGRQAARA